MAFTLTTVIPGDVQTEGTAAYRLKAAIDWHQENDPPKTLAEYEEVVQSVVRSTLRAYVRQAEAQQARRTALENLPNDIEVTE